MSNDEDGGRIKRLVEDLPKGGDMRRARESKAELTSKEGFSVVAPMKVNRPDST
jgi:hypothetical protein